MTERRPLIRPAAAYHPFYAMWLLERLFPEGPRLGQSALAMSHRGGVRNERIRLRPNASLLLPAGDLEDIYFEPAGPSRPERVAVLVNFMGLYGPTSPLPSWYAEFLAQESESAESSSPTDEDSHRQPPGRAFVDILNHRLLALRYRVWLRSRPLLTGGDPERALWAQVVSDQAGQWNGRSQVDSVAANQGGLWLLRNRPACALRSLLQSLIAHWLPGEARVQVALTELAVARWLPIPLEQRPRLGAMTTGRDALIGKRQVDRSSQLGIDIGPLSYPSMLKLMPGGELHEPLLRAVSRYLRRPLQLQLQLGVPRAALPQLGLSRHGQPGLRLGGAPPQVLRDRSRALLVCAGDVPALPLKFPIRQLAVTGIEQLVDTVQRKQPDLVVLGADVAAGAEQRLAADPRCAATPVLSAAPGDAAADDFAYILARQVDDELWRDCATFTHRVALTARQAVAAPVSPDPR